MKYKTEKTWNPPPIDYISTNRNIKREEKQFSEKIQKKASPFLKWIYNNYFSNFDKNTLFEYYKRNDEYCNFIGYNKELNSNRLITKLIYCNIINEKEGKVLKRKWLISKILQ